MIGKLYLSRGDGQDIYIDNCQLSQYQIDGIRFMYRQLKKKNPGVILNDPTGDGTALQVVLLLNAIKHILDKPILILCNHDEQNWVKHFRTWTKFNDEVIIVSSNPFIKNMSVWVNRMENIASFSRRDWSVLIVESDCTTKEIIQSNFNCDFKIWITSVDLKDDLYTFSLIYNWLYPKVKFNKKDFEPATSNPKDVITKAIQLDAFMEDIVYESKNQKPKEKVASITPQKVTRKNKDAIGTKIKRSKRNLNTDIDLDNAIKVPKNDKNPVAEQNVEAIATDNKTIDGISDEQEKMDVETFIRDREPIGPEAYREYLTDSDSRSQNSQRSRTKSLDTAIQNVKHNTETDYVSNSSKDTSIYNDQAAAECHNEENNDNGEVNGNKDENLASALTELDNDCSTSDLILHYDDDIENETETIVKVDNEMQDINDAKTKTVAETKSETKVNSIDFKMKELEDMTMKKFKGSFLDSLF